MYCSNFCVIGGGANNPKNPYSCVCLHGDRRPPERKANLEKFKQQKAKFLICTDVAARGIDITGLPFSKSLIIHFYISDIYLFFYLVILRIHLEFKKCCELLNSEDLFKVLITMFYFCY